MRPSPSESESRLNLSSIARNLGIGLLSWIGFDLFVLVMMLPLIPGNAFTWWTVALAPLSCLLVAGPLYLALNFLRSLSLVQLFGRLVGRIPLLLRMLFAILAGTGFIMALSIYGGRVDTSAWHFSNPFAVVRLWS